MELKNLETIADLARRRTWRAPKSNLPIVSLQFNDVPSPEDIPRFHEALGDFLISARLASGLLLHLEGGGYGCFSLEFAALTGDVTDLAELMANPTALVTLDQTSATSITMKHQGSSETWARYGKVKVPFFTNRAFENKRFTHDAADLSGGVAEVLLPAAYSPDHKLPSIWEIVADHLGSLRRLKPKLGGVEARSATSVASDLDAKGQAKLLIVHGFATSFRDGLIHAAKLGACVDADKLKSQPCAFLWPSFGDRLKYQQDTAQAEASENALAETMDLLGTGAPLDLIAHSHGNKIALRAATLLKARGAGDGKLRRFVMVAPDVDERFLATTGETALTLFNRQVLYSSRKDVALRIAERKFGAPRAGRAASSDLETLEIVDASAVAQGLVGHSYHTDTPQVVTDLHYALADRPAAFRHGLFATGTERVFALGRL